MVGVASPLYRVPGAVRFYAAFAVGLLVAAAVLSMALVPANLAFAIAPESWRTCGFLVLVLILAILDLRKRTPHLKRQVPQRFGLQGLPMGALGFVYGADVGLLVTTIKVTSLLWVAIAGAVMLASSGAVVAALITAAVVHGLVIVLLSAFDQRSVSDLYFWGWRAAGWMRAAQVLGAVTALVVAGTTVIAPASSS